jgi:antirestriction protein ArdC
MPKLEAFNNSANYYSNLFHELVHSSGHKNRLNRMEVMETPGFGNSEPYSKKELTAKIGAWYLKSYAGLPIKDLENNAAYIQGWLKRLKGDRRFIIHASGQAQKAVDYILNVNNEEKVLESSVNNHPENEENFNLRKKGKFVH